MAEIRCPMCGESNQEGTEFCRACQARLKPLIASSPDDLPLGSAGSDVPRVPDPSEELPDWLKALRADSEPLASGMPGEDTANLGSVPAPDAGQPSETAPDALDWLRNLGAEPAREEKQEPADWLSDLRSSVAEPGNQPEQPADSSFEPVQSSGDWLDRLEGPLETPAEPAPAPAEDLPDWLKPAGSEPLAALEPAEEQTPENIPAPAPQPAEETLPDWLETLKAKAAESGNLISGNEEFPDWLAGMPVIPSDMPASAPETEPDWLNNLRAGPAEPVEETPVETPSEPVAEVPQAQEPDWLKDLRAASAETLSEIPPEAPETVSEISTPDSADQPDWLQDLKTEAARVEAAPPSEAQEPVLPDWLSGLSDASPAEPEKKVTSVFKDVPSGVGEIPIDTPDWLSSIKPETEELPDESVPQQQEIPGAAALSAVLPDWLADIGKAQSPQVSVPPLTENGEGQGEVEKLVPPASPVETPEWLSRLHPERAPETHSAVPEPEPEDLQVSDLPDWVQAMRPVEAVVSDASSAAAEEVAEAESSGPLAGLRGVLPAGAGVEISRRPPAYSNKLQVTESQIKYASQLEKMIVDEGQASASRQSHRASDRVWRWIVSFILIISVLFPLVLDQKLTPDMQYFPSEWSNTKLTLDALPDNAPVLMVMDYEPAFFGEMQASASPLIDRVLTLGGRLTFISTNPTGPALAEQFLQATQLYHLDTGMQYVNLGYLPGGPAGIQYFATSPQEAAPLAVDGSPAWSMSALKGVGSLDDFALLVILTDSASTGRAWIEQTRSSIGETPILMVISAQAEPMIRPYYDAGQIQGMVTGLVGGKTYEQTFELTGMARTYWDSFGTGTLLAVILMVSGGLVGAVLAITNRKKEKEA